MSLLHAVVVAPTPTPMPVSTPEATSGWEVFIAIGAVVGFLAAVIQLFSWLRDVRLRRAQTRLLEIAQTQLNAEDANAQAATSAAHLETIRQQIEQDLPNEARRAYIQNRIQRLERSLAGDYQEYMGLRAELEDAAELTPLAREIRTVVEQTILPGQHQQHRKETFTILAVCILLLINFLPIDLGSRIWQQFIVLASPFEDVYSGELASALLAGTVFWSVLAALIALLLGWSSRPAFKRSKTLRLLTLQQIRTAWICLVCAGIAVGAGLLLRELLSWSVYGGFSNFRYYRSEPGIELLVGVLFSLGVPLASISMIRLFAGVRFPRRGAWGTGQKSARTGIHMASGQRE